MRGPRRLRPLRPLYGGPGGIRAPTGLNDTGTSLNDGTTVGPTSPTSPTSPTALDATGDLNSPTSLGSPTGLGDLTIPRGPSNLPGPTIPRLPVLRDQPEGYVAGGLGLAADQAEPHEEHEAGEHEPLARVPQVLERLQVEPAALRSRGRDRLQRVVRARSPPACASGSVIQASYTS